MNLRSPSIDPCLQPIEDGRGQGILDPFLGKSASILLRDRPDFKVITSRRDGFGKFGEFAMNVAGNQMVRSYRLVDPAHWIGDEIAKTLASDCGIRFIGRRRTDAPVSSRDEALTLDIETTDWGLKYHTDDNRVFDLYYHAVLRVIDGISGEIILQETFKRDLSDAHYSSLADLTTRNAARLKLELRVCAEQCLTHFQIRLKTKHESSVRLED